MSFLTKLLAPKPKAEQPEDTTSLAHHNWLIAKLREDKDELRKAIENNGQDIDALLRVNRTLKAELTTARAEAEAAKEELATLKASRAKGNANLKQFRKADAKPMDAGTF